MGHETADSHNLSKHITDYISGHKDSTINSVVINIGPSCTNMELKQCSHFDQSMYLIRCLDNCSNKFSLLAKPGIVHFFSLQPSFKSYIEI